mgnify:CR=1 FL=1
MFAAFREGMKNNSHFARPSIWIAALLIVGCSDTKTETVEVPVPGATVTTTVVETVTVEVETTSLDFGEATVAGSVQFTLTTPPTTVSYNHLTLPTIHPSSPSMVAGISKTK